MYMTSLNWQHELENVIIHTQFDNLDFFTITNDLYTNIDFCSKI